MLVHLFPIVNFATVTCFFVKQISALFQELTQISTIQGVDHIFSSKTTFISKTFWLVVFFFLLGCGISWSNQMYNDWQNQQVLTTIKTTSYSIKNVQFPSVTFCTPGNMEFVTNATLFKMFYDFLGTEYGIKVDLSPMHVAETINLAVTMTLFCSFRQLKSIRMGAQCRSMFIVCRTTTETSTTSVLSI